jgi:hypothetical protein
MLIESVSNFKISLNSHVWFPSLAIILRIIPVTADFSYIILAGYALLGRQQIIQALMLSWLFSMLNPVFTPNAEYASFTRYIIILTSFFSIFFRANFKKIDNFTAITAGLGFFFIIHGFFFSQVPQVSILKALNWTLIIMVLLLAWKGMDSLEHEDTKKWIMKFILMIVLVSIFTLLNSKIGFYVNANFFHGILNHPQAFGMTAAALGAILIGRASAQKKITLFLTIMIILCILLIIISGSRTSGLALLLAVIISSLLFPLRTKRNIKLLFNFSANKPTIMVSLLLITISVPIIFDRIASFINKNEKGTAVSVITSFQNSRGVLYAPMMGNILQNPLKGIGFGLASDLSSMNIKYFKSIPVSAPVEKGVLPLAVLEEVGVFGFIFFIIWILILIRLAIANSFGALIVLLTFLLFNLGEAGLFSANGFGMLYLIIITSVVTKSKLINNTN